MSITKVWACTAYPMRCRFLPFWIQSNICKWLFSATNGDKIISNLIHTANVSNIKITVFFLGPVLGLLPCPFTNPKLFWTRPNCFENVQFCYGQVQTLCGQVQNLWTGTKKILSYVNFTFWTVSKTIWRCPKQFGQVQNCWSRAFLLGILNIGLLLVLLILLVRL